MVGAVAVFAALIAVSCGSADAEPVQDTVANLKELSRQADQISESLKTAQQDFDRKMALLGEADKRHTEDLAALDAAKAQLSNYQGAVDKLVAAVYMGGSTDSVSAMLTAASPKQLIDKLAIQRSMATEMTEQMQGFRRVTQEAQAIEAASAKSEADAKAALDAAGSMRADLQRRQAELQTKVTDAAVRYAMLPPAEQAAFAGPNGMSPPVMAVLSRVSPVPTVGMSGLVPNARGLVQYIMATYPGVRSIGGVRSDPLPDHPSGHAVDIMIGSNMALGDDINADVQSQAGRFGVVYTMWRVASHFDHVHVTVS
ncbi:MAG: hypothetical protein ACR2JM_07530 [Mycobacterium sp.]